MAAVIPKIEPRLLPPVLASPTTWQYSRTNAPKSPYYKPRFQMKKEDWDATLNTPKFRTTNPLMPPYPYGRNYAFPEANYGLYGGSSLQSGHKISKGRNKGKTLRKWYPNVRVEEVRSDALDKTLKLPITARAMRTIKKVGGLDNYVLGDKPARIKELGLLGWKLRWLVLTSANMRAKLHAQRQELGLDGPPPALASFEEVFLDPAGREKIIAEQESTWERVREAVQRFETHWKTNMGKNVKDGEVDKIRVLENDPRTLLEQAATKFQQVKEAARESAELAAARRASEIEATQTAKRTAKERRTTRKAQMANPKTSPKAPRRKTPVGRVKLEE